MKYVSFKMIFLVSCVLFFGLGDAPLQAAEELDPDAWCQEDQVKVKVKGVVCSFCAYGVEKNLSKLTFLDKTQFGSDGVLIDISTQFITLAMTSGKQFDLEQIYDAIQRGGYDPVTTYMNLTGKVKKDGERYFLTQSDTGQVFNLAGQATNSLSNGKTYTIQASLLENDDPVKVEVREVKEIK